MAKKKISSISMPAGLSKDQRAEFARLMPALEKAGINDADQSAVIQYLEHWEACRMSRAHILKHGRTTTTPNGSVQVSPHHTILRQNSELLMRWSRELGATPMGRKRLGVGGEEPPEDDDDLIT
jgi:P27 family predicted phage terminase small subunit